MLLLDALRTARWGHSTRLAPRHRVQWFLTLYQWLRRGHREVLPVRERDCTAIILSYKRPQNIAPLVGMLLQTPSIRSIIVSNNNPDVTMRDWLRCDDPRVTVIEQGVRRPTVIRYQIALEHPSPLFIAIDDDVFLRPSQVETLCATLRARPDSPCGFVGCVWDPGSDTLEFDVRRPGEVDILNQTYLFTSAHVQRFFDVASALGFGPGHEAWSTSTWDDIVLSRTGLSRPYLCDVGAVVECPTSAEAGIAAWQEDGFLPFRLTLLQRLQALRPFAPRDAAAIAVAPQS